MIEVFEGRLGGGKTYSAVVRIAEKLAEGYRVYTNIALNVEAIRFWLLKKRGVVFQDEQIVFLVYDQIEEFILHITSDSLVVIDEAHIWFNARDWAKTSRSVLHFLTQSRKVAVDVIFITQSALNIDKQFARLVQYVWRFRDMSTFFILPGVRYPFAHICQAQFDYDGRTRLNRFFVTKDPDIFKLYDTNALLSDMKVVKGGKVVVQKVQGGKRKMHWIIILLVVAVLVAGGIGAVKVFGFGSGKGAAKVETVSGGKSSEKVSSSSAATPVEEPDFLGARFIGMQLSVRVYSDRFRVVVKDFVATDSYAFRVKEMSRAGIVEAVSGESVLVKGWDGERRLIVRDFTPDPPRVFHETQSAASPNYSITRSTNGASTGSSKGSPVSVGTGGGSRKSDIRTGSSLSRGGG